MSETAKAAVARLTRELFNDGGNPDVVDELLAEDFLDHTPGAGLGSDREAYKQRGVMMRGPQYRFRDGKIVELWGLSEAMSLMKQLGAA